MVSGPDQSRAVADHVVAKVAAPTMRAVVARKARRSKPAAAGGCDRVTGAEAEFVFIMDKFEVCGRAEVGGVGMRTQAKAGGFE